MVKSKTKISKQTERKTNSYLVKTINLAKKNPKWIEIAEILSGPRKNWKCPNLEEINKTKGNVIVAGKILSQGEIKEKRKIVAVSFSEKAKEKLKKAKCDFTIIAEEIKKNPERKDLKIFKNG